MFQRGVFQRTERYLVCTGTNKFPTYPKPSSGFDELQDIFLDEENILFFPFDDLDDEPLVRVGLEKTCFRPLPVSKMWPVVKSMLCFLRTSTWRLRAAIAGL